MKHFATPSARTADDHHILKIRAMIALITTELSGSTADAARKLVYDLTETRHATLFISNQTLNMDMLGISATANNSPAAILRAWQNMARSHIASRGGAHA